MVIPGPETQSFRVALNSSHRTTAGYTIHMPNALIEGVRVKSSGSSAWTRISFQSTSWGYPAKRPASKPHHHHHPWWARKLKRVICLSRRTVLDALGGQEWGRRQETINWKHIGKENYSVENGFQGLMNKSINRQINWGKLQPDDLCSFRLP